MRMTAMLEVNRLHQMTWTSAIRETPGRPLSKHGKDIDAHVYGLCCVLLCIQPWGFVHKFYFPTHTIHRMYYY